MAKKAMVNKSKRPQKFQKWLPKYTDVKNL